MVEQMMKVANLDVFAFHAMSQVDPSLKCFEFTELGSHFLDLSDGWDAYHQWARKNSVAIKRQKQKTRKMGREIGPIRFEFDCQDTDVLESLIELKRGKYQRSNTFDILSVDWASNLLREIRDIDQPGFKGLLSAIYAGDQLVAAHFGMLTDDILHYWFPVYDPQFHRYSPVTELLLEVAREACDRGVSKLDLGYGDDEYKFRFCNGHETVSCGQISFSKVGFQIAKQRYFLRQKLKGIPMKPLVKSVLRGVFPGFGQWNFK
jgi:CelD/BcsL family acetyltransferase involved in cellulose biosynthesis